VATEPLFRKIDGNLFLGGPLIARGLERTATTLGESNYLRGLSHEEFAPRVADLMLEINGVHPFRERNGRAQRVAPLPLREERRLVGGKVPTAKSSRDRASSDPASSEPACLPSPNRANPLRKLGEATPMTRTHLVLALICLATPAVADPIADCGQQGAQDAFNGWAATGELPVFIATEPQIDVNNNITYLTHYQAATIDWQTVAGRVSPNNPAITLCVVTARLMSDPTQAAVVHYTVTDTGGQTEIELAR
jgi:hypothetical protein